MGPALEPASAVLQGVYLGGSRHTSDGSQYDSADAFGRSCFYRPLRHLFLSKSCTGLLLQSKTGFLGLGNSARGLCRQRDLRLRRTALPEAPL